MPDAPTLDEVRRPLVVGLGRSGRAAARALADRGLPVLVVDEEDITVPPELADVEVRTGAAAVDALAGVDLVVPSPGVPDRAPVLTAAAAAGVAIWSEPELAWRLRPHRLVGVTGTNGKTSVTELTTAMLQRSGIDALACGNIGTPLSDAVRDADPAMVFVAELSSFQLRFCEALRPEVGVLLNLAPDHLDWHVDVGAYGRAKARLWQAQQAGDHAVVNADDAVTLALGRAHAPAGLVATSGAGAAAGDVPVVARFVDGALVVAPPAGDGTILTADQLAIDAPHHRANVAAAAAAALLAGAAPGAVAEAARAFRPGRHRLEVVARRADGVRFVDDSKATNVHAAAAALDSYEHVVWIAGGLAKGVDLSPLAAHLGPVRHAVLIGEAASELLRLCAAHGVSAERAPSMESAVRRAAEVATRGDTVLLAPACASFDQFADYADRGDRFAVAARTVVAGEELTRGRP